MRLGVIGGVTLGLLVVAWQLLSAATGLGGLFPIVATAIEVVVLVGTLAAGRSTQGYRAQLGTGLIATLTSLPLIGLGFLLTVFVVFPELIATTREETQRAMQMQGASPEQIEATLAMLTPAAQGAAGLIGTFVTGLLIALVAPLPLRKRQVVENAHSAV